MKRSYKNSYGIGRKVGRLRTLADLYEANRFIFEAEDEAKPSIPIPDKRQFLNAIKKFSEMGTDIYRSGKFKEAVGAIEKMVNAAESVTLSETDGWFDKVTASRHIKQMKDAVKVMKTEAAEIIQRQQRLEAAYEDIGHLLKRYYDI